MSSERPRNRREIQAEATRRDIVAAARKLFAERGYGATTVAEIARAARVSPQTIYDSVGSKARIIALLNDLVDAEAGVGELAAGLATADDAFAAMRIQVQIPLRILQRCGDIVRAATQAGATDPELAAVRREGQRRHASGCERVAARLEQMRALRIPLNDAVLTLTALTDVVWWAMLEDDYGWNPPRIAEWVEDSLKRLLFAVPDAAPGT